MVLAGYNDAHYGVDVTPSALNRKFKDISRMKQEMAFPSRDRIWAPI